MTATATTLAPMVLNQQGQKWIDDLLRLSESSPNWLGNLDLLSATSTTSAPKQLTSKQNSMEAEVVETPMEFTFRNNQPTIPSQIVPSKSLSEEALQRASSLSTFAPIKDSTLAVKKDDVVTQSPVRTTITTTSISSVAAPTTNQPRPADPLNHHQKESAVDNIATTQEKPLKSFLQKADDFIERNILNFRRFF